MNCDRLAPWYCWLEYLGLGRELERRREQFLPEIADAGRVLMLGEGDGRFLATFLRVNPHAQADYVDLSGRMLSLAAQRAAGAERVRFHHADAREWMPPQSAAYDLIVTHFFLDCFTTEQLTRLVNRLGVVMVPRARWIVSEFHQPDQGFGAWRARLWIGGLYAFFRLVTGLRVKRLPAYRPVLEAHGFRLERVVLANGDLLVSELWRRP